MNKPNSTEARIKRILDIIGDDYNINATPWTHNLNGNFSCFMSVQWKGLCINRTVIGKINADSGEMISRFEQDRLIGDMKQELAEQAERLISNVCAGVFRANGLEPRELFEDAWLETWLRDRGWIHG